MTTQEEQLLNALVDRLNQTPLQEKDPDAEALLNQKLGANRDALYMLAQTVLVQNIALDQAQARVSQLEQQLEQQSHQPARTTSFLGRLLGEHDQTPAPAAQATPAGSYQQVPAQYSGQQPFNPPAGPQYQQVQYVPSGQPSFLSGALQTAAGVAAGAIAFEGVESILRGFGHGGYGLGAPGFGGIGMGERPVEETVINNYYDEPGREHSGSEPVEHHAAGDSYSPRDNDRDDNLRGFSDQNAGDSSLSDASNRDDQSGFDDSSLDDSSNDSGDSGNGGFDDGGGGFDDGGGGF